MSNEVHRKIESAIRELLASLGEDLTKEGLKDTPQRYAKQLAECLAGYSDNPEKHLKLFTNTGFHDLITVSNISFSSICEHHLMPFFGYVDIAYIPTDDVLGLSKFARIVDSFSKRLQIQERLTNEISSFLQEHLKPGLLAVRIRAHHTCMIARGAHRPESITETTVILGATRANKHYVDHFREINRGHTL